jgi:hypothetical protein
MFVIQENRKLLHVYCYEPIRIQFNKVAEFLHTFVCHVKTSSVRRRGARLSSHLAFSDTYVTDAGPKSDKCEIKSRTARSIWGNGPGPLFTSPVDSDVCEPRGLKGVPNRSLFCSPSKEPRRVTNFLYPQSKGGKVILHVQWQWPYNLEKVCACEPVRTYLLHGESPFVDCNIRLAFAAMRKFRAVFSSSNTWILGSNST